MDTYKKIIELAEQSKELRKEWQAIVFDAANPADIEKIHTLIDNHKITNIVEGTDTQLQELATISDPTKISHTMLTGEQKVQPLAPQESLWVYYPWHFALVHIVNEADFKKMRLSRNEPLITKEEQAKVRNLSISFAGLNVGNPCAVCCALEGIGEEGTTKLADFDPLSATNLNRFRAGLIETETNKAIITARQIVEVNPFAQIDMYEAGLKPDNLEQFLQGADILVEEIDNLKLKIALRDMAKAKKIPVIMVTGDGENVILDVERYDLENPDILNGHLAVETIQSIQSMVPGQGTFEERVMLARDFMGPVGELNTRLYDSFSMVGKSLAGIPQLAESSFCRGAVIAHAVRRIFAESETLKSGRYRLNVRQALS